MGGVSGLIYSALPVLVLVPVNTAFGLLPALFAALAVAAAILVWRLVRRDSVQPALAGFIGVGISALIAWIVGASKGYFLLGIWTSLLWAAVFGSRCSSAGPWSATCGVGSTATTAVGAAPAARCWPSTRRP